MTHRKLQLAVAAGVILLARAVAADPSPTPPHGTTGDGSPLAGAEHIETPSTLTSEGGSVLKLPPGYFFDEPSFLTVDREFRRLQTAETRLTAENASMKQSLGSWQPGWWTLAGVFVGGCALGWYVHEKL